MGSKGAGKAPAPTMGDLRESVRPPNPTAPKQDRDLGWPGLALAGWLWLAWLASHA